MWDQKSQWAFEDLLERAQDDLGALLRTGEISDLIRPLFSDSPIESFVNYILPNAKLYGIQRNFLVDEDNIPLEENLTQLYGFIANIPYYFYYNSREAIIPNCHNADVLDLSILEDSSWLSEIIIERAKAASNPSIAMQEIRKAIDSADSRRHMFGDNHVNTPEIAALALTYLGVTPERGINLLGEGNFATAYERDGVVYKIGADEEVRKGGGDEAHVQIIPRARPEDVRRFFMAQPLILGATLVPYEVVSIGKLYTTSSPTIVPCETVEKDEFDYMEALQIKYILNRFGLTFDYESDQKTFGYFFHDRERYMVLLDTDFMRPLMPDGALSIYPGNVADQRLTPEDLLACAFCQRMLEEFFPSVYFAPHKYLPSTSGDTSQDPTLSSLMALYNVVTSGNSQAIEQALNIIEQRHKPIASLTDEKVREIFSEVESERGRIVPDNTEIQRRFDAALAAFPRYREDLARNATNILACNGVQVQDINDVDTLALAARESLPEEGNTLPYWLSRQSPPPSSLAR